MRNTNTILGLIRERGRKGLPLERVYRLLYEPDLYVTAYGKIYRNQGAMTPGITAETADGMSQEKIATIIKALRDGTFRWHPVKRTYIPKKNGKMRPLGMPTWTDKLVQEVIRLILEAYYEPQFSERSHGFRPQRGCATALKEISYSWTGVAWFIEGDISQCFDKLDHQIMLEILRGCIHDERFIRLISELLKTGYLEAWKYHATLSGTPQGGILSPILANIYLDRLDKYVETRLVPANTRGKRRRGNRVYNTLLGQATRARRAGRRDEARRLKKQAQRLPSHDTTDPTYRRLRYVRYADDFLLGFIGPKAEAEEIKRHLEAFLQEELKLELSQAKTLITHARTEAAQFLGYEVHVLQRNVKHDLNGRRSINGRVGLRVPKRVIQAKCRRFMRSKKTIHRAELLQESDFTILETYQAEYRGLVEYYRLAYNLRALSYLKFVMEKSLVMTLANKLQKTVLQVYDKYETTVLTGGKPYKVLQVIRKREGKEPLIAQWGGITRSWDKKATLNDQPPKVWNDRSELEQRLLANCCEYCESTENIEVHHIRALKDLRKYPGREKPAWVKMMAARQRKTMVVCRTCHEDITLGRPMRRMKTDRGFMNVEPKARKGRVHEQMALESRVQ
jgi:group II intron reverse transcriptase/maturase